MTSYRISHLLIATVMVLSTACGNCADGSGGKNNAANSSNSTANNPPNSDNNGELCGNGTVDTGEQCDGAALGGEECASQGFASGSLSCNTNCTFDTSACEEATCGDGIAAGDEACDGNDLGGSTCATEGFTNGTLVCNDDCGGFDTTGCYTCGNGTVEPGEVCDDGNTEDDFTCASDCLSTCRRGFGVCDNGVSTYCGDDGETTYTEVCDPMQGLSCDETVGRCVGTCSLQALGTSYIGCDYFPTVTANVTYDAFSFAVAISNTTGEVANVNVTQGTDMIASATVQANSVEVLPLPWVDELKGGAEASGTAQLSNSVQVTDGAYRLRSDQPVTVYQFSPIEYRLGASCPLGDLTSCSYTNDASLLLPSHVWGDQYRVIAWPHWPALDWSALYAVTAREDGTTVQVTASPSGGTYRPGVTGIDANGNGTVTLDSGDVFEIFTENGADPTGTLVTADKPIQVIAGHQCTNVPFDQVACDHLEESMYPLTALSTTYILTAPLIPTNPAQTKIRTVRIVATQPNTMLTYDPVITGAATSIAQPGEIVEFASDQDVVITASEPVIVAEYMHGQSAGGNTGDPAMALGVATDQYRTDYLFHAPTNYEVNYVNVVAQAGALVTLDGQQLANWEPIGNSPYQIARVELDSSGDGNHRIEANTGIGIVVYGYGQYTSYWYPGGSNVKKFMIPED